jgi:AraC family transcriptional regulator, transcriptional activator of the genes for pyochelin and ferripyochelin receptors
MPITISEQSLDEIWQAANPIVQQIDTSDPLDILLKVPPELGYGFCREIKWHQGLHLAIEDIQLQDDVSQHAHEHEHIIQMGFQISGYARDKGIEEIKPGCNWFCGSGLASGGLFESSAQQRLSVINIHIDPVIYQSFVTDRTGEITPSLLHMFRSSDQHYSYHYNVVTTEMQVTLRQIMGCPYHGITKRIYLESKILELLALMVDQELEYQNLQISSNPLKLDDIDRIYQARDILSKRLNNPPSLIELARMIGLNDNTLKRGFRKVFGTTVFGFLHEYRLLQAEQLLSAGNMKVTEVGDAIGFSSRSYFAIAFRKKFGLSPKEYQMQCQQKRKRGGIGKL